MSDSRKIPLIRNEHGAPCGIDWRQVPGMALSPVPGVIDVRDVMPGDSIRIVGQVVTVLKGVGHLGRRSAAGMHLITRTAGGAEIVHECVIGEQIEVVATGAFGA